MILIYEVAMFRRLFISAFLAALMMAAGCSHNKVQNPIANIDSKQPDKVLFDRAMDALKHNHYDVARITLQTLINTYPDSEYVARAKLGVGDSWYAEGGATGLAQAEIEYKDFITFFPNMPEAAEAQLKVANIHYRQMEKPDRDFTHAKRAEEEYRQLLLQFPDSKLVPQAQQRLREVQEVLAEREFRIGTFYAMRGSPNAAIARLQTVTSTYPLYSGASEALMLMGKTYEKQIDAVRAAKVGRNGEQAKGILIQRLTNHAAEAYDRVITRYPATEEVKAARHRLEALGRPVPTPTPQAVAESKAEEASRSETGRFGKMMGNFRKHPDVNEAAKVGEPTLTPPAETSAVELARDTIRSISGPASGGSAVSLETRKEGAVPASDAVPTSSAAGAGDSSSGASTPAAGGPQQSSTPSTDSGEQKPSGAGSSSAPQNNSDTTIPALKPLESNPAQNTTPATAAPDSPSSPATPPLPATNTNDANPNSPPSDVTPPTQNAPPDASPTAPQDTKQSAPPSDTSANDSTKTTDSAATSDSTSPSASASSSKKKKKKSGLGKLNPF
jgi:outer membrane protein assembly factor BamD